MGEWLARVEQMQTEPPTGSDSEPQPADNAHPEPEYRLHPERFEFPQFKVNYPGAGWVAFTLAIPKANYDGMAIFERFLQVNRNADGDHDQLCRADSRLFWPSPLW